MPSHLLTTSLPSLVSLPLADWQVALIAACAIVALVGAVAIVASRRGFRVAAVVADRVVVYAVLAGLLLSVYVAASLVFTSLVPARKSFAYEAAAALMALFVAVTYAPVSTFVQRMVDTVIYRDYYDYERTLQRFSQQLAEAYDQETLAQTLVDGLMETLNLSGIAFVPLPEGLEPQVLMVIGPDDLRARGAYATAAGRAEVLRRLAQLDMGQHWSPPSSLLTPRPWKGCAALVYIGSGQQAGASALLVVGPKAAGGPLRREDNALLLTIAHQAATALANAQLVSGLRISLQQVQIASRQLDAARAEQEMLARELVNADERQRASLARELHDDALQEVLYVIRHSQLSVRLADAFERSAESIPAHLERASASDSMSQLAPASARLRRELEELAERSTIVEKKLRALCLGLYPDMLYSLGLTPALEDLAEQVVTSSAMRVSLELDDEAVSVCERLDAPMALHLYRIAQEALSNAHKHGHATGASIELTMVETPESPPIRWGERWAWIRLRVRDNGAGMALPVDIGASLRDGHLGLASMRERTTLIGGQLRFDCAPEGGAQVTVIAPIARIQHTVPLSSVRV